MSDRVRLAEKFAQFHEHWSPRVVGELNTGKVRDERTVVAPQRL